jgi:hypothetical protein
METEKKTEKLTSLLKNEKIKNEQNEKKVKFKNNEGKENENDMENKKKTFQNKIEIEGKRHNSVINPTINFGKKFFFSDENIVELIDSKGNIKKEKIKDNEIENKEFKQKRQKRNSKEFILAVEFSQKLKDDNLNEKNEEIINNTIKNQFGTKFYKLDDASSRAPRKHKTVECKKSLILNQKNLC